MAGVEEIVAGYEGLRAVQEAFYQDLHRHPELSHQEDDTARRVAERNHSPKFLPPMQPTLRTGTEALVAAAPAWLAP
jgi:metal-dependent amidase/aminoacylase/carboxypeptidase family protein